MSPAFGSTLRELLAARLAGGVHLDPGGAAATAQDAVVLGLEAGGADPVAGVEALVGRLLELLLADLADVAEEVRAEAALWVVAHVTPDRR